jgi:transcriptional antiterminator RfaH
MQQANIFGDLLTVCNPDWFAVYTKPRQEHVALLNLEGQAFECYLPMVGQPVQRRRANNAASSTALFPRYLFLNAAPDVQSLASVGSTRGVVGLVRAGYDLIKIPASIIAGLKKRMHPATGLIALDGAAPRTGDKVRVFDGPFADMEGVFKERRGGTRSLLLLEILGRETAVEIDARLLQRVN